MNTKENLLQPDHVRRPYASPVLQVYGNLAQVTAANSTGPGSGDSSPQHQRNTRAS